MAYRILTLIDITETGENHGPDEKRVNQQANWNTLIQVLGLRANPSPLKTVSHSESITGLGFGTAFKGKQRYWECEFEIEYGEVRKEAFLEDFDLVPIITGLDETAKLETPVFYTEDPKYKNIVILPDKDF